MGQLALAIPAIYGTLLQGESAYGSAKTQALQLEQQAGQDRASSQRAAIDRRRSARYVQARLRALAAGSGAGASDPTILNLDADIAAAGEYSALVAMYEGEDMARGKEFGAKVARKEGKAARNASYISAASKAVSSYVGGVGGGGGSFGSIGGGNTLLASAGSWYDKYGGGGPGAKYGANGAGIYGPRYG